MRWDLVLTAAAYLLLGAAMYVMFAIFCPWIGVPNNQVPLGFMLIGLVSLLVCIAQAGTLILAALEAPHENQ